MSDYFSQIEARVTIPEKYILRATELLTPVDSYDDYEKFNGFMTEYNVTTPATTWPNFEWRFNDNDLVIGGDEGDDIDNAIEFGCVLVREGIVDTYKIMWVSYGSRMYAGATIISKEGIKEITLSDFLDKGIGIREIKY